MKNWIIKSLGGISVKDFLKQKVAVKETLTSEEILTVEQLIRRYNDGALERIAFRAECARIGIKPKF